MIRSQRGAAAIEYALLMSVLVMGLFSSTNLLNDSLQTSLNKVNAQLYRSAPRANSNSTDSGTPPAGPLNEIISGPGIIRTGLEGGESSTTNINGALIVPDSDDRVDNSDGSRIRNSEHP